MWEAFSEAHTKTEVNLDALYIVFGLIVSNLASSPGIWAIFNTTRVISLNSPTLANFTDDVYNVLESVI